MVYFEFQRMGGTVKSALLFGAVAFALSGCLGSSSSSGGVGGGVGTGGGDRTAGNLQQASQLASRGLVEGVFDGPDGPRIRSLLEDVVDAAVAPAPEASALAGTASYSGDFVMVEVNDDDLSLLGDFAMTVNFDNGSLTGNLGNQVIVDDFGDRNIVTGSATINGTVVGNNMNATLAGTYGAGSDVAQVNGNMSGSFVGTGAETVAGGIAATVTSPGERDVFEGVFSGNRLAP